jgi:putative ABC transport system substrate-binding protein
MARPGGNLTGQMLLEPSITGKWLAMLKEIAPRLTRVALMRNTKTSSDVYLRMAEALAPSLVIELLPSHVETAMDIERAIESVAHTPDSGLLVAPDSTVTLHRDVVIALALRHRVPAVYHACFSSRAPTPLI